MPLKTRMSKGYRHMDNGCSSTWLVKSLMLHHWSWLTTVFGNNGKGKIVSEGTICNYYLYINDVFYIDCLKHNLLSISQLCDKGHLLSLSLTFILFLLGMTTKSSSLLTEKNVYIVKFNVLAKLSNVLHPLKFWLPLAS